MLAIKRRSPGADEPLEQRDAAEFSATSAQPRRNITQLRLHGCQDTPAVDGTLALASAGALGGKAGQLFERPRQPGLSTRVTQTPTFAP